MRTPYTVFPNAALLTICILLLCCSLPTASYKFSSLSRRFLSLPTSHRTFTSHSYSDAPCWRDTLGRETQTAGPASPFFFRKSYLPLNIVTRVRGGASVSASSTSPQRTRDTTVGDITIFLTSNFGLSPFLQKTQKIKIPRNASVAKLKEIIQEKFPGHPPIGLQNLYLESKILRSDKILGHLTNKIVLTIQLDLMSGTMMYNRTFALSKAIDAYISLEVHEAYLNNKLTEVIISPSSSQSKISNSMRHMLPDSFKYRQLYKKLNESFYETYASDIKAAFEAEKDPSIEAEDTRRWQSATIPATVANKWGASTIKDIIRHELLLNDKSVAKLTYWSSALMVMQHSAHQCYLMKYAILLDGSYEANMHRLSMLCYFLSYMACLARRLGHRKGCLCWPFLYCG